MIPLSDIFNSTLPHASVYLLQATQEHPESLSLMDRILHSNVINVVLVLVFLGWVAKKFNLLNGIDAQREKITSEIVAIENQKKEALAQLEEARQKTAQLDAEVKDILANAREAAELLSGQIITDAKKESEKLVENAKRRIELEQRTAIKDLEKRLLNDALSDARTELANTLTFDDQKRSVETFLNELSALKGGKN